jgi:hypothetical protein
MTYQLTCNLCHVLVQLGPRDMMLGRQIASLNRAQASDASLSIASGKFEQCNIHAHDSASVSTRSYMSLCR